MDKITLSGMAFFAHHGDLPEEQSLGQRFRVELTVYIDLLNASRSDRLSDTIDYSRIYAIVAEVIQNERHALIEKVAGRVVESLFAHDERIERIQICVKKPSVPIPGMLDFVAVELDRTRS
jgi:dihydroneopterin aldolase